MSEPSPPADRGNPSIAMSPKRQRIVMGSFAGAALVAMFVIAFSGGDNKADQPLVTHEEIAFKTSDKEAHSPYIKPEPLENKAAPASTGPAADPLALQREQMMQAEAMRMAQEQQKRQQQRLQSPQIVYDQTTPGIATPAASGAGAGSLGGDAGDANLAFAAQAGAQGYETSRAARMQNVDTLIAQGTMIAGILETAIQSDLAGMVRAVVSDDIYSFDGSTLIIPKGSKIIGQYRSGLVRGQSRVFVIWNRIIRNDGVTVNLGSFGTDDLGRAGLDGKVDTHFFERFGSAVLLSMIDTSLQIIASNSNDQTSTTVALNTGNDFSRAAEIALENSIAIPPTVNVAQGKRIKVFVSKDLDFSQVTKTADAGQQ